MIDIIIILLMSLPLIVLGSTIGPDSSINFGSRIPKAKLKSEEGLKRLRRIKIALILAGSIILVGGFACLAFHWEDYQLCRYTHSRNRSYRLHAVTAVQDREEGEGLARTHALYHCDFRYASSHRDPSNLQVPTTIRRFEMTRCLLKGYTLRKYR